MEFKWTGTVYGTWRLLGESDGCTRPLVLAFARPIFGEPVQYVGTVFGQGRGVPDMVFSGEYTLEEIKLLLETTVVLKEHGDGV